MHVPWAGFSHGARALPFLVPLLLSISAVDLLVFLSLSLSPSFSALLFLLRHPRVDTYWHIWNPKSPRTTWLKLFVGDVPRRARLGYFSLQQHR